MDGSKQEVGKYNIKKKKNGANCKKYKSGEKKKKISLATQKKKKLFSPAPYCSCLWERIPVGTNEKISFVQNLVVFFGKCF